MTQISGYGPSVNQSELDEFLALMWQTAIEKGYTSAYENMSHL